MGGAHPRHPPHRDPRADAARLRLLPRMGAAALASIGLISFAAIAQIAPAFFGGLFWRRGNARGRDGRPGRRHRWSGPYMLLLPSLADTDMAPGLQAVGIGLFGLAALRPPACFGFGCRGSPTASLWSLGAQHRVLRRVLAARRPARPSSGCRPAPSSSPDMPAMAQTFRLWRSGVTVDELRGDGRRAISARSAPTRPSSLRRAAAASSLDESARPTSTCCASPSTCWPRPSAPPPRGSCSRSCCGGATSPEGRAEAPRRCVRGHPVQPRPAAARARPCPPGHHRVRQRPAAAVPGTGSFAICAICRRDAAQVGVGLDEIVALQRRSAAPTAPGEPDEFVAARLESFVDDTEPVRLRLQPSGNVIEIRSTHMPDGGIVTTYTDITERVEAEEALARANETLERRVRERTEELTRLNAELGARQGRGRRGQRLQDALPGRGEPRHPAAAQRRAALRDHRWSSAPRRRRPRRWPAMSMPRSTRSRKSSPRCSTFRGSIPAR